MLRGTVWTVRDGIPTSREVIEVATDDVQSFKVEAQGQIIKSAQLAGVDVSESELEFGPIGEPWH